MMRVIRDEDHIRIRSSIGQYATLGGLLALLVSLVLSFVNQEWFVLMLVSALVGFILSAIGGFFADRYAGPFAHHEAAAEMLKGLDYSHTFFQYTLPASHVLLSPGGCTVFVVKSQAGQVSYDSEAGKWKHRQRWKFFHQMMGKEALGTPHEEAEHERQKLRRYLDEHLEEADEVPVQAVILFVNPDVELDADGAPVPAIYRKKIKGWLRGPGDLEPLPDELYQRLVGILGGEEASASE
jgi:hypothetical protein